jgi:hypothetical protein
MNTLADILFLIAHLFDWLDRRCTDAAIRCRHRAYLRRHVRVVR